MEKVIFIITSKPDPHPSPVIRLLNERKIPFFRLNTEALMTDYDFTWVCDNSHEEIVIQNITNGQIVHGSQIKSVWWRRPTPPSESRFTTVLPVNSFNMIEAKTFYKFLIYYLSDRYSVGSVIRDRYASSKMVQLRLAAKLAMRVPVTCITNTMEGVVNLAKQYPEVLLKPLGAGAIWGNKDQVYEFYAKKVCSSEIESMPEESFSQTVNFCENYVPKDYEVRVTVIGPHIFACRLDSQKQKENEGKIDWRQGYDFGLKHEMIKMPDKVETFCQRFLRELGINFGCFDFIVRPDGEYVFLECNPNGQWGWIEEELGITDMTEAMVDCLVNCLTV